MNGSRATPRAGTTFKSAFALLLLCCAACRTVAPLAPANLSEPGWRIRPGQAVWTPPRGAAEIAGELLLATHPDGRSFVQFTKTPFPIVVAQTAPDRWQIEFVPQGRSFSGRGQPPSRLSWFQLAPALAGQPVAGGWQFQRLDDSRWRLENERTGERLEGYLAP